MNSTRYPERFPDTRQLVRALARHQEQVERQKLADSRAVGFWRAWWLARKRPDLLDS